MEAEVEVEDNIFTPNPRGSVKCVRKVTGWNTLPPPSPPPLSPLLVLLLLLGLLAEPWGDAVEVEAAESPVVDVVDGEEALSTSGIPLLLLLLLGLLSSMRLASKSPAPLSSLFVALPGSGVDDDDGDSLCCCCCCCCTRSDASPSSGCACR